MDAIKELRDTAEKALTEADRLIKLQELYPDLKRHVGRWGKIVYCSASVNTKVTDYEQRFNCGCCSDSPLEIWPYLNISLGKVYSDPACFQIGERDDYGDCNAGVRAYPDWKKKLRDVGIPEDIVTKIGLQFESTLIEDSDYVI